MIQPNGNSIASIHPTIHPPRHTRSLQHTREQLMKARKAVPPCLLASLDRWMESMILPILLLFGIFANSSSSLSARCPTPALGGARPLIFFFQTLTNIVFIMSNANCFIKFIIHYAEYVLSFSAQVTLLVLSRLYSVLQSLWSQNCYLGGFKFLLQGFSKA